jgi:hypothetical protein
LWKGSKNSFIENIFGLKRDDIKKQNKKLKFPRLQYKIIRKGLIELEIVLLLKLEKKINIVFGIL